MRLNRYFFALLISLLTAACSDEPFRFYVVFPGDYGLAEGNAVMYAGVEVGYVEETALIHPAPDEPAMVQVSVAISDHEAIIRDGDNFSVRIFGLLGEHYLDISPSEGTATPLREGAVVVGQPVPDLKEIFPVIEKMLDALVGLPPERRVKLLADFVRLISDAQNEPDPVVQKLTGEQL